MWRIVGVLLMAASIIAGIGITITGDIGESATTVRHQVIAGVSIADVDIVTVPNWWVVVPLVAFFLAGLACVLVSMKKSG
jgi:hypothetical protein